MSALEFFLFPLAFLVSAVLAEWIRRLSRAQVELRPNRQPRRPADEVDRLTGQLEAAARRIAALERRQDEVQRDLRSRATAAPDPAVAPDPVRAPAPVPPREPVVMREPVPAPEPMVAPEPAGPRPSHPGPARSSPTGRIPAAPPHLVTLDVQWLPVDPGRAMSEPRAEDRGRLVLRRTLLDDDWADETWARVKTETAQGTKSRASLAARDRLEEAFAEVAAQRLTDGATARVDAVWAGPESTWQAASRSIAGLHPHLHGVLIGDPVQAITRTLGMTPATDHLVGELAAAVPLPEDGPLRSLKQGARLLGVIVGLATGNHLLAVRLLRDFTPEGLIRRFTDTVREALFGTLGRRVTAETGDGTSPGAGAAPRTGALPGTGAGGGVFLFPAGSAELPRRRETERDQ